MAKKYFSAEIMEVHDGRELEGGGFVLNMDICHEAETILGDEEFEPRITMFGRKARQALERIKEGAKVIFTGVKRNPRSWVSEGSGKTIQQVELIAEGFKVIKKGEFDDIVAKIREKDQMFDIEELEFTNEDAETLAREAEALAGKDDLDDAATADI